MTNKRFLIDDSKKITYLQLFEALNQLDNVPSYIYNTQIFDIFKYILLSLVYDIPITLLDYDFSNEEIKNLGINENELKQKLRVNKKKIVTPSNFLKYVNKSNTSKWSVTLFTSGTTGLPKKVTHTFSSITRMVKINKNTADNVWGFAYNPTHIAGLQVFFQAVLNINTIVNIFGKSQLYIFDAIKKYSITNISATPTFFRMLLPHKGNYKSVKKLTSGGERFDVNLSKSLLKIFPNAKFLNVYASTEAGTILASKGDHFEVTEKEKIKIINNELLIHKSLLGDSDLVKLNGDWYYTGDEVEIISENPLRFKFVKRKNEMINVGGYKVNPLEVEELLNKHKNIIVSKVYGKKNSVLGNILMADVKRNGNISEKDIQIYLRKYLQEFKIPRIINFVDEIQLTRTGKLKRK